MYVVVKGDSHYFMYDEPPASCSGKVGADVSLRLEDGVDELGLYRWRDDAERPSPCIGSNPDDEKEFVVFRGEAGCQKAGFKFVSHNFLLVAGWKQLHPAIRRDLES